ncbi:MAG: Cof-type HAD-IIB family hydrolase [Clostridia bacterium]|nr:Cof-type HAD-IIB family hydrolase [Clostridia bacterium]
MYKLVAIDLDGTLLNSGKIVSERNKEAIKRAIEKGIKIIVCSGRIYAGAKGFARQIYTNEPLVACNGAVIKDIDTGEILYSNSLRHDDCLEVIEICRAKGIYFHVYIDDTMYTEKLGFSSLYYWKRNQELPEKDRVDIRVVESLRQVVKSSSTPPSKVVAISEDPIMLSCTRKHIEEISTISVMSSNYDNFEVVNHGVSKAKALSFISEKFGIKREEIIAIGDNENDYSMIQFAGIGIAMGNAEEIIKNAADYITLTNNEDGVAHALNKFVL